MASVVSLLALGALASHMGLTRWRYRAYLARQAQHNTADSAAVVDAAEAIVRRAFEEGPRFL